MGVIDRLQETKVSQMLAQDICGFNEKMRFRVLKGLSIKEDIVLSIQASRFHYCVPRETLPLDKYTSMELGILKSDKYVKVDQVTNNEKLISSLNNYYEGPVYSYVPIDLIEDLYQQLKEDK